MPFFAYRFFSRLMNMQATGQRRLVMQLKGFCEIYTICILSTVCPVDCVLPDKTYGLYISSGQQGFYRT